jgi:hypothetical protein
MLNLFDLIYSGIKYVAGIAQPVQHRVTGWMVGFHSRQEQAFFFINSKQAFFFINSSVQTGSRGPHSLLSDTYRGLFPGVKAAGAWRWLLTPYLLPRSRMELYLHSPIWLHAVVINFLRKETTYPFFFYLYGDMLFLRNVGLHTNYTTLYRRRWQHSYLLVWEPQILQMLFHATASLFSLSDYDGSVSCSNTNDKWSDRRWPVAVQQFRGVNVHLIHIANLKIH